MTNAGDVDRYWRALDLALPTFREDERRAALTLYRELAEGSPVSAARLAAAMGVPAERAEELLGTESIRAFVHWDDERRVLGFGGLSAAPMSHSLELEGRTLWTWCAWDSLFIPAILGETARVVSRDPRSGATIRISVAPDGIRSREPGSAVVSFLAAEAGQFDTSAANVMASFCHHVFFFESRESGEEWAAEREGAFILSLDEAADLARRLNTRNWGDALPEPGVPSGEGAGRTW